MSRLSSAIPFRILKYLKGPVSEKGLLPGTVASFPFGLWWNCSSKASSVPLLPCLMSSFLTYARKWGILSHRPSTAHSRLSAKQELVSATPFSRNALKMSWISSAVRNPWTITAVLVGYGASSLLRLMVPRFPCLTEKPFSTNTAVLGEAQTLPLPWPALPMMCSTTVFLTPCLNPWALMNVPLRHAIWITSDAKAGQIYYTPCSSSIGDMLQKNWYLISKMISMRVIFFGSAQNSTWRSMQSHSLPKSMGWPTRWSLYMKGCVSVCCAFPFPAVLRKPWSQMIFLWIKQLSKHFIFSDGRSKKSTSS